MNCLCLSLQNSALPALKVFVAALLFFVPPAALCAAVENSVIPTNAASLRALNRLQMNRGRPFSLSGVVTMADPQRNIFILQDSTGAVLIHPDLPVVATPGTLVALKAESAAPYVVNFPEFPFSASGSDIQPNFEGPTNWGDFHLTRMAGFLHPPETGEYTFWISSDNSSDLWLSTDEDPAHVRLISSISAGSWVNPREWSRFPSQRSEPTRLEAGRAYYIEAFTEQVELDEHLAVAWRGPGLKQAIIEGRYLTPWTEPRKDGLPSEVLLTKEGLLREYWTNFTCGNLIAITGGRPAETGFSARGVHLTVLRTNTWPEPVEIDLGTQLAPEHNYRWVRGEARASFIATENGSLSLELTTEQNRALVRAPAWQGELPSAISNWAVRVEGVCEGAYASSGALMPGIIWVPSDRNVKLFELPNTNTTPAGTMPSPAANAPPAMGGYFSARGVVTFNGRAMGKDYLVVQDANAGIFIVPPRNPWPPASRLLVGDSVQIGGTLLPTRYAARLSPRVLNLVGPHTLPAPVLPASQPGRARYRDGQWTELEGVIRTVEPNGTLLLKCTDDSVAIWLGGAETGALEDLVDSTLRVRGVMSLDSPELPLLLVPSRTFVQILEPTRTNLVSLPISTLKLAAARTEASHRARITGVVTYRDEKLVFVEDDSGAMRVQLDEETPLRPGDNVEVSGFPEPQYNSVPALMDARARKLPGAGTVKARRLDLNAPVRDLPNLMLVQIKAYLLGQKDFGTGQALEVQAGQRVFQALLPGEHLPRLAPGSLLELTGVCALEIVAPTPSARPEWESPSIGSARLLLRTPADVTVLRGPPWWNWKKAAALIALLVILLTAALLRVHLLRRRFEKQQAARLAFARQLLENQESERRRIAANLHDTLGQNLLAIKNQTHLAMQAAGDTALQRRLEDISGTVLNALEEVRQITHDLRPYQLDRLGLSQAIRSLVRKVSEGCPIELASHVDNIDGLFPKESEINIYRIVQEGINNVIKHSQATEAAVVLKAQTGALRISIRDNGRGLSAGQTAEDSSTAGFAGFGLSGIRERARIMNGRVEIEAAPGEGFNLKIEIPLTAGAVSRPSNDKPSDPGAEAKIPQPSSSTSAPVVS